ncbi:MAG: hypothetical protein JW883_13835 [Deltaproteobacteria bacterium]|nr:hypothetical protein [Deltaproteobacteria bacterium]
MKSKILLYRSTVSLPGDALEETTVVTSPVSCLHEATEKKYGLIVIIFDPDFLKERNAKVELCAALKRNRHTMQVPLLCVLPSKHRDLLERLQVAKVKYVMIFDPKDSIQQSRLEAFASNPSQEYEITRTLSEVCPHINYFPVSRDKEILYCGAYRNRLVLGPYRLRQYCETNNHINCEYFRNPR